MEKATILFFQCPRLIQLMHGLNDTHGNGQRVLKLVTKTRIISIGFDAKIDERERKETKQIDFCKLICFVNCYLLFLASVLFLKRIFHRKQTHKDLNIVDWPLPSCIKRIHQNFTQLYFISIYMVFVRQLYEN